MPAGSGLLAGAGDPGGDRPRAVRHRGPAVGPLLLNGGGSFRYRPPRDFHGLVAFFYRVRDGHGGLSAPLGVTSWCSRRPAGQ